MDGRQTKKMQKLPRGCVPADNSDKQPGDPGYIITHEKTDLQLVWVPGTVGLIGRSIQNGHFLMGSTTEEIDKQWRDNRWSWKRLDYPEQPKHPVELSPFLIARTEVTNAVFAHFVEDRHYNVEGKWVDITLNLIITIPLYS